MKHAQVLIDVDKNMSSVSLLEDGRLNEFYAEFDNVNLLTGNIYKGKVVNVLQGLQTAFVDIGLEKNGFLYVGETLDDRSDIRKSGLLPSSLDVKEGDYIMVQVTKEETRAKGARLSMNISLPGRHIVYLPTMEFTGVSNKITDTEKREKLIKIIEKFKKSGEGFIARTVCADAKKNDIISEAKQMQALYSEIVDAYNAAEGITQIHSEGNLLFRTVRDMLSGNVQSVICNDLPTVEFLKQSFKKQKSRFYELVEFYQSDYDMMDIFGVTGELDKLSNTKVDLQSGGSIIIEKTEALTVIDVNTARFKGTVDHEETVFLTNKEAAAEIARQIRLRNIGGIIVIDFIDMTKEEHRTEIVDILKTETAFDRIKTRVLDMSGLGLVQITRKKVGGELDDFLFEPCPYCHGSGKVRSSAFVARKVKAGLKKIFADNNYTSAVVSIDPSFFDYMFSSRFFAAECQNEWRAKRVYMVPSSSLKQQDFIISGSDSPYLTLPQNAKLLY